MANLEPTVEFWKARVNAAAGGLANGAAVAALAGNANIDISYWTLAGLHPQSGNWVHKIAAPAAGSIAGETALWATLPPAWGGAVDSGAGFIGNSGLAQRDIIQGNMSEYISVLVFNNKANAANVSAAENCFLRVYDDPTVVTQTKEPMVGLGGGMHTFWTQLRQRAYWLQAVGVPGTWAKEAPGMTVAHLGPFHIGGTTENQWSPVLPTPNVAVKPFDDVSARDGLGYFACGSGDGVADKHYLGCANGGDPLTDCGGGAVELEMKLYVPETATAKALYWALAIEYTFVVE